MATSGINNGLSHCILLVGLLCLIQTVNGQSRPIPVTIREGVKRTAVHTFDSSSGDVFSFYKPTDSASDDYNYLRWFQISENGVVTITQSIDYVLGEPNLYYLTVIQRPRGQAEGGKAHTLAIQIEDTNNFPPSFKNKIYYGHVAEGSAPGVVVDGLERCHAEDRDSSGIRSYRIISGNEKGYFEAKTSTKGGTTFLILSTTGNTIKRDAKNPDIVMTIEAQDGGSPTLAGTTKVQIQIRDSNNNAPVFDKPQYQETIPEDTPVLKKILRVRATDADTGTNGAVYYYMNPLDRYFSVDAITGDVVVVKPLDFSQKQTHSLTIYAVDRGFPRQQSQPTTLTITLAQDKPGYPPADTPKPGKNTKPYFSQPKYTFSIGEDFPKYGSLLTMRASDNDPVGPNKQLEYTLTGGAGKFIIDPDSGTVTLASEVDYDKSPVGKVYNLQITATDQGSSPESTTTTLVVEILHMNKNRNFPTFLSDQQAVVKVNENSAIKTEIYKVRARDLDSGNDGKISYSLEEGSGLPYFKIDPNTGSVVVNAPLDRENGPGYYELVVVASDNAMFPLSSRMFLMITIEDENDNNPYFTQPMYLAKVPENSKENTFVTLISAKDPDAADSQSISYQLLTASTPFKVDPQTGIVRTSSALQGGLLKREYEIQVSASSSGASAQGQINITITSKADVPPDFKNTPYKVKVPENMGNVPNLMCIAAVDSNNKPVTYSIASGAENMFGLDKDSGRLYSTKSFDYEDIDRYNLRIEAFSGSSRKRQVPLSIEITEEPDAPSFSEGPHKITIKEDTGVGITIPSTRLSIIDADTNGDQFDCSLENVQSLKVIQQFHVLQSGGECRLELKKKLDSFVTPDFKFDVKATDQNNRHLYATAKVEVKVDDVNDHKPEFSKTSYWISVPSTTPASRSLVEISAIDMDTGTNGDVRYELISGDQSQRFKIDGTTLSNALSLSPDVRYQLQVTASDLASPPQSSRVTVYVSVYGASDSPVEFVNKKYSKSLPEDAARNTPVFKVRATKLGLDSGITYELVGGHKATDGTAVFSIDSKSGQVLLVSALDREVTSSYTVHIRAKHSGGSVAMATDVEGVVTVTDVNDNDPTFAFEGSSKIVTIENYTPEKTVIMKALAFDPDAGKNGEISYSVVIADSTPSLPFSVDSKTGEIKAKKEIVFSSGAKYTIKVRASDGGSNQRTKDFTFNIQVVNTPRPPKFKSKSYRFEVLETALPGSVVPGNIQAEYSKTGAFLKYHFVSGNKDNTFCIDGAGRISMARSLDREKVSNYQLKVRVELGKNSDETLVNLVIKDVNDEPPYFAKSVYTLEVEENKVSKLSPPVSATDLDEGPNGVISYRILQTIDMASKDHFSIDTKTGEISVETSLDYENATQHTLFIKAIDAASDGGSSLRKSSITQVNIKVKDKNDNPPVFAASFYRGKVALDADMNQAVIQVHATDLDSGSNGEIQYSFIEGNNGDAFQINTQGFISVKKSLTTVVDDKFTLKVKASDQGMPPKEAIVNVDINVFLPDGPPMFVVSPVVVNVEEGVTAGNRVAGVKAATSEALTYVIISGNDDLMFTINPSTGQLYATRTLDYEEKQRYKLEIAARDTRDRSAAVTLIINVVNINDNKPTFVGEKDGQIDRKAVGTCRPTNIYVGEVVTPLAAVDKDKGDTVTYDLDDKAKEYFEVDPKGNLRAKRPLEGIQTPFKFKVKATDDGKPPQENSVDVRLVFVHYRPDQDPVRVDVLEDTPVGTVIARVPRYLPNGTIDLLYPEKANFSIKSNGDVVLLSSLDYETRRFHSIIVREKQVRGKVTNDVDVEITVLDVNDNTPYFTKKTRIGHVNTNSRAGAKVYQLNAKDGDGGSSGLVGYQLESPETNNRRRRRSLPQSPFTINPKTKQLEVAGPLEDKRYKMPVKAFDYGIPRLMSESITLSLDASKSGQLAPQFTKVSYHFKVSEDAGYLTVVGTVKARSVSGARLDYRIIRGNTGDKFKAMENGNIVLNSLLDFERDQSVYNLKVEAVEQIENGLSSSVDVQIDVINANDHVPYFANIFYSKPIPENTGVGTIIHTAQAYDCDCIPLCHCAAGQLEYSVSPSKGKFAIDPKTGDVSVGISLDHETSKYHLIKIIASDKGKKIYQGISYLNVTITNVNDNSPLFSKVAYAFDIAEKAGVGVPLAVVRAADNDGDKMTYKVSGGSILFDVETDTGVIKLKKAISASSKTQYSMKIKATDDGQGQNSNDVTVNMNIIDANDHRPIFKNCPTSPVTIEENLPIGQRLIRVEATDQDRGKNGRITYTIEGAESQTLFEINSKTGEIKSKVSFDREHKDERHIVIKAEDGMDSQQASERLLSYCYFKVNILDINDNRPYFAQVSYYGSVINTARNGTTVLTVEATDKDVGSNAEVKYSLQKNDFGLFKINPSTGVIYTNGDLKKYVKRTLRLIAVARDKQPRAGEQPGQNKQTTTNIEIVVTSIAPPKFTQDTYRGSVKENSPTMTSVLTIKATPTRSDSTIIYLPVNTNPLAHELFRVMPKTGEIVTGTQADYEAKEDKEYELSFMAKEVSNHDVLYSTCKVIINVQDVNDVSPTFQLGLKSDARVLENANPGTTVIDMVANDKDTGIGRVLTYELKSDTDTFQIDSKSGQITTKVRLDRETRSNYPVLVKVTDGGGLAETASVTVYVVDENDQPPVFAPKSYSGSLPEDSRPGKSIVSVFATDKDIGDNAKLRYFISKGDPAGKFAVKTESDQGTLVVRGELDYESVQLYNLEITATDGKNSDTATVTIKITDVNDLAPIFSKPLYTSVLAEKTKANVAVTTVTASDFDGPSVSFSLDNRGKGFFTVGTRRVGSSNTYIGDIKTGPTELDREASPVKAFSVIASDGKHTTQADVTVNLTDVNDNAPRFPSSPYIGYVKENQPAGTSVMYVQAVDDDDPHAGGNAKVTYTLTDSAGGKFKIHPTTGKITTLAKFDRETPPDRYKVKVRATDGGNPKLSGEIGATIIISDENDWAPEFTEKLYRGSVSERAPPGFRVTAVSATDKDTGPNAEFEFVVTDGNYPHGFYVDPYNGSVLVSGILDYETKKSYRLTVRVNDRGIPPLKGKEVAYVEIEILDANDNAPIFIPKEYKKSIPETDNIGKEILRVTAVDKDSGTNGDITFSITGGNIDDIYVIKPDPKNKSIGIITNRLPIDREAIPLHHLQVTAKDPGGLTGIGDVWLTVKDVNDNGPWFVPPVFVAKIKENTNDRQFVTKLSAIDPDEYVPGRSITFKLVNGTQGGNFKIDTSTSTNDSVEVYAHGSFDREENPIWKIGVLATESIAPKKTNFTYIYVDVGDENDNTPSDGSLLIIVNAYDGKFKGGIIGKPYYKDKDFDGDKNTYSLESQSPGTHFEVNSDTGDITAPKDTPLGKYDLKFSIKQGGTTVSSIVTVLVRSIDSKAVENGVAMQFRDMRKPGYFVGDYHDRFIGAVAGILDVSRDSVQVFSVQKATDMLVSSNVFFVVKTGDNEYKRPLDVINAIVKKQDVIKDLGLSISKIGIDECAKEKRKIGKCTNLVIASPEFSVTSGDHGQVPAPDSSLTLVSMDVNLKANYTPIFSKTKRCKPENPCLNGGTCYPTVPECPGFVCKCLPGYHGPLCELTTRTFYGNSYIWLPKLTAYEMSDIEFEFITETANGLLLYQGPLREGSNNGAKDFIAVPLVDGRIETHISLGHEPVVIKMDKGPRLDDGLWHTVQLSRNLKNVEIIIDRCSTATIVGREDGQIEEDRSSCHVYGKVLGRSVYLDGFGPLQIGGVQNADLKYPKIPYTGFKGCIRNIKDNRVMYDLEDPLLVNNAPKGCELAKPCPDCNGKGYCEPLISKDSICVCNLGHSGNNCNDRGKASFYLDSSFTQYLVRTSRRKRRELLPPPKSILNKYYTNIALQVKVQPDASDVVIFLSANRKGTEFQRVDVKDHKIRYVLRIGNRIMILSFPQLNITDNVYHTVVIQRQGNRAAFQLDYDGFDIGSTRGERTLIDMGGGTLFAGGLPNVTIVRIVEAILEGSSNVVNSPGEHGGLGFGSGALASLQSLASYLKVSSDAAGFTAFADKAKGVSLKNLDVSSSDDGSKKRRSRREAPASVIGDFGGCISGANVNGADLESHPSIVVKRQNVMDGCPCVQNHCLNGGTCINAMPPYCICPPGWTGPRCGVVVTSPNPGQRGTRWANPAVIATILVVLLAVLVIMAAVLLKRRPVPLIVPVDDHEDGHVHDNVRLYHDEGGGEEDNLGYDITKLMKYTYIETTGPARARTQPSRAGDGMIDVPEKMPLLEGAPPSDGPTFGLTGQGPPAGTKLPKYAEGDDIGDFISTRVKITNREVYLAVDEIHVYRYEGDDSEVDDLSEIEEEDEDDEFEQEFEFLKQWGSKFDNLSKMYEGLDD